MSQFKALIFDVDGTLAETEAEGHRVAFNLEFERTGLPWHWDDLTYACLLDTTGGKERIARWIRAMDWEPTCDVAALHAYKNQIYAELVRAGKIALRPGVADLITRARAAGVRLAIATTTTPANVSELIESTMGVAALGWFEVIGAGDVVQQAL